MSPWQEFEQNDFPNCSCQYHRLAPHCSAVECDIVDGVPLWEQRAVCNPKVIDLTFCLSWSPHASKVSFVGLKNRPTVSCALVKPKAISLWRAWWWVRPTWQQTLPGHTWPCQWSCALNVIWSWYAFKNDSGLCFEWLQSATIWLLIKRCHRATWNWFVVGFSLLSATVKV